MVKHDPQPWISALRSSHDRLAALVGPLLPDAVEAPSMASEWSIAQVMSHLGSQAEIFGAILAAALAGDELPGPDAFPPVWDVWNARTPQEQVTASVTANAAFLDQVEALSPAQLDALQFAMFGMELDMSRFLQMRVSELALHSWDVAAALDPAALVAPDAVELVIDTLPEMARRAGKPQEKPLRIRVVTSSPSRDLVLAATDPVQIDAGQGDDGSVDGVLRLPAEAWVRLVYGRLDDKHAVGVELDADGLTLDSLRAVFAGV